MWTRGDAIKPSYTATLERDFNALAEALPDTAAPINKWVSERTAGKIENLLDDATVGRGCLLVPSQLEQLEQLAA